MLAQHGDRRVARLNPDGKTFTTIVDRYDGKRFNSPNDLCFDRKGNLYFTDPPYGTGPSTVRELDYQGVYRVNPDGKVTLLSKELARPNGIAVSPDQRILYVANSDNARPVIMAYEPKNDGTVGSGRIFFDSVPLRSGGRRGAMDGMEVDAQGNLWATRSRRRAHHQSARQPSRHAPHGTGDGQLRVRRRRLDAVYHRRHVPLPGQNEDEGSGVLVGARNV